MKLRLHPCVFALLAAILFPVVAARAAGAAVTSYDAIYVFGDSYCDVGNLYLATKGAKPLSPPYYKGRFSNGPIWVEHFAGSFNLTVKPALAGGTDFAFGGAELLQDTVTPFGTIPSVFTQVDEYLAKSGGKADPNALYVLEGGGNDILNATSGSPGQLGFDIGAGLASLEVELRQAGAEHFVIPNLLDVGILPAGRARAGFDETAVKAANDELNQLIQLENTSEGIQIVSPNIYALFHAIEADPTHFGFDNVINPCLNNGNDYICADPAHRLFWDDDHPTSFGHSMIAVAVEALVHP